MRKRVLLILTGIIVLIADQAVKFFLVSFLKPSETIPIIKNIFHITLVFNTGCAFGLFRDQSVLFFITAALIAIILLIYFLQSVKTAKIFSELAATLIIAGSLSNLIDRFRCGYVIDFLDFRVWPVFNLGDTAITIGVSIFILQLLIKRKV